MKERFWSVYYWLMVGYLLLSFIVIISYRVNYQDTMIGEKSSIPRDIVFVMNEKLFFEFMHAGSDHCHVVAYDNYTNGYLRETIDKCKSGIYRLISWSYIGNFYPFILVFLMTLIRFILTGKHIWQRPETG